MRKHRCDYESDTSAYDLRMPKAKHKCFGLDVALTVLNKIEALGEQSA